MIPCPHCQTENSVSNDFCSGCAKILPPGEKNYFETMGFKTAFDLDLDTLETKVLEKQTLFHPDKFINTSELERAFSLEHSNAVNVAYNTLKSPFKRAAYLLKLNDHDVEEQGTDLDPEFLMETMEWREELMESDNLDDLLAKVSAGEKEQMAELAENLRKGLYSEALSVYIRLKFIKRFKGEIKDKL